MSTRKILAVVAEAFCYDRTDTETFDYFEHKTLDFKIVIGYVNNDPVWAEFRLASTGQVFFKAEHDVATTVYRWFSKYTDRPAA